MIPHEETVYIVSGYMRTGTSMMMKALEAGGLEAMQRESRDTFRQHFADEEYDPNEGGLYELEQADYHAPGFPLQFKGKLVKLLNAGTARMAVMPKIKIVYMRRDYEEIRQSFQAFFSQPLKISEEALTHVVEQNIASLENRKDVELVVFWYRDVVADPAKHFEILRSAGWPIEVGQAMGVVQPELARFKKEELTAGIV